MAYILIALLIIIFLFHWEYGKVAKDYDERFLKLFTRVFDLERELKRLQEAINPPQHSGANMVIYTSFGPDERPHIYEVPQGINPELVAETWGLNNCIWGCADNEAAARIAILNERN